MNILFIDWNGYGREDMVLTLTDIGCKVDIIPLTLKNYTGIDEAYVNELAHRLNEKDYDAVFTLNYYPAISESCNRQNVKYLCWIYDSPFIRIYSPNITNPCNFVFVFDKVTYQDLRDKGIDTVYYLPLGANIKRLGMIKETQEERCNYAADVSFVGSLYNEKHNLYDRLKDKLDDYSVGYLEGLMNAQKEIYGCNFLQQCIPNDLLNRMHKAMSYEIEEGFFTDLSYVYANYFLCRKITEMERKEILTAVSERFQTNLYTFNLEAKVGRCKNKGSIEYLFEMPKVFRSTKINLNITLKSIQSGIPLRAMDILGAGGFLMSNYQEGLFECFVPDQDFVYYTSKDELLDKIDYYLKHEEERKKIAFSGYERMRTEHDYRMKLYTMFQTAGLIS